MKDVMVRVSGDTNKKIIRIKKKRSFKFKRDVVGAAVDILYKIMKKGYVNG